MHRLITLALVGVLCIVFTLGGRQVEAIGSTGRVDDVQDPQRHVAGTWAALLRFDETAVYEYQLAHITENGLTTGSLRISVSPDLVIFQYSIGEKNGAASWQTGAASPGEAYMAALLADGTWHADEISLLWTPFVVSRWAPQFSTLEWRVGPGWATRGGMSTQFTIDQMVQDKNGAVIYRAHLETSAGRLLDIDVNLQLSLPTYIKWTNAAGDVFEAVLQ